MFTDWIKTYIRNTRMPDMFENMYEDLCGNGFFKGVSGHFAASANHELSDDAVGKEIILRKVKRMQDKMVDTEKYYTFDLLEELIFAHMVECAQEIAGDDTYCWDKEAEMKTEAELKEKFRFSEIDARKVARQCYRLFEMGPEDDAWMEDFEEESLEVHYDDDFWESTSSFGDLFFWDTDYSFFWRKGFIEGLHLIEGGIGDNDGYGYDHACEIFTDIGMKPPASLLGTKEANRITVELEKENESTKLLFQAKRVNDFTI